jgi:hypothetical protein
MSDEKLELLLETWRRETDWWHKRAERVEDQAGALLTACLTVGVVGAAAAGYVNERQPDRIDDVQLGIVLLIIVGFISIAIRNPGVLVPEWISTLLWSGNALPPETTVSVDAQRQAVLSLEIARAKGRRKMAIWKSYFFASAISLFVVAIILITHASYQALGKPT